MSFAVDSSLQACQGGTMLRRKGNALGVFEVHLLLHNSLLGRLNKMILSNSSLFIQTDLFCISHSY